MVENRRPGERNRLLSARNHLEQNQFSIYNSPQSASEAMPSQTTTNTNRNADNNNNNNKSRKIVLFDSSDDKDITNDSSSSNGSESRTNANVTFRRSPRLSARSNRSSGGTSSSSNGTDPFIQHPPRPSRSASTPAPSRSPRGKSVSSANGMTPRSPSRTRVSSRSSVMSSESLTTPRLSSRNRVRRRIRCDTSTESLDSQDYYSPREMCPTQPLSPEIIALTEQSKLAWDQFSTHVKTIDDSTDLIARRPRQTFNSSGIFQKAMEDLYGSPDYWKSRGFMKFQNRVGAIAKFASKFIVGARKVKATHESKGEDSDEEDLYLYRPSKETVDNAQRGWRLLKQYVQETAAEKRMSQTTLSWDMLRHTIKGISNMERARIDLYQRYGLMPLVKSDGTVVQENTMLSERARSAVSSSPKPATPTSQHSSRRRSATTRKMSTVKVKSYAPIEGFSGTRFKAEHLL